MSTDRSWVKQSRATDAYDNGVKGFLDFAFQQSSQEQKISCPCKKCRLLLPVTRDAAYEHLILNGFVEQYTTWVFHGEVDTSSTTTDNANTATDDDMCIDVDGLLHGAFGYQSTEPENEHVESEEPETQPNVDAEHFYSFVKDANKELYPGCKNFTKLTFVIRLFHIKCLGGWSNNSFSLLLKLLNDVLPEGTILPQSFYEMKKIISKLGLGYEKIHACPNDCILYRNEYKDKEECSECYASRYKVPENNDSTPSTSSLKAPTTPNSKIPAKVLRYFPLIPRLQRLFMCSETASSMRWHENERTKDGYMRHPADSPAWITFDYKNPNFSEEPRNVRLGLASDGMNPFRTMSTTYSIWPVILQVYNLPPWMCLNPDNFILSMIIPGPDSPGNNMDIYLRPLIDELILLWEHGIQTYDISLKLNFQMRAALLWTISDLPALAYLSGWSTKGKYACICCHKDTCSTWLKHGRKFCYTGHRRFLEKDHRFRKDVKSFDGLEETRLAPTPLHGSAILKMLEGYEVKFGKTFKNPELPYNWKKRSIFMELPYWPENLVCHNLDAMHLEKNTCESLLGTMLFLEKKAKDGLKARLDLELMGLKKELHPIQGPNDKTILPPACFSLQKTEKITFYTFLKRVKVPDGYASNISRSISVKDRKIYGLKSHDCHILIQQLLPLALRGILDPNVYSCIVDLSNFFREIYSKVKRPQDFLELEDKIAVTLCKLEKIFPPAFFDICIHLLVHLPRQARLAGPVQYREMYPIERYLLRLKSFVTSKSQPEGSIAEAYLVDECLTFCSRFMEGVETRLNRPSRNNDDGGIVEGVLPIFSMPGRPLGKGHVKAFDEATRTMAHQYVLCNCEVVDPYKEQHMNLISQQHSRMRTWQREKIHSQQFPSWFGSQLNLPDDDLMALAHGPHRMYTSYKKYIVNGFRFHTRDVEARRKTQNSGVILTAQTRSYSSRKDNCPVTGDVTYYGILIDIIEVEYLYGKRIVLFECDWVANRGIKQEKDCVRVNFDHLRNENPYILASQAEQVMYLQDLKHEGWRIAVKIVPRSFYDMDAQPGGEDVEPYLQSPVFEPTDEEECEIQSLVRHDMPHLHIDVSLTEARRDQFPENFEGEGNGEEDEFELLF